ncbi:hypothetical protein B0I35DRAFT_437804 [Stachybotrys elegans]|uniref:BZIP domain-containing protein n=1 Tax=Stachybotrys elegans TaxID=80388 RepID=A0A8K0WMW5_9HYPO|nr:hypothetical protein B0I35DRAFT_437804 [Stachybotrys elegans]
MASINPTDSTPVPSEPWACGRLLTKTQREQKRERDRIRKRRKRSADSEFIKSIESRLLRWEKALPLLLGPENSEGSESAEAAGDESIIPELRTGSDLGVTACDLAAAEDDALDLLHANENQSTISELPTGPGCVTATDFDTFLGPQVINRASLNFDDPIAAVQGYLLDQPTTFLASGQNSLLLAKEVLGRVQLLDSGLVCTDEEMNQDTLIQGTLHGWQSVFERKGVFCPLWSIISTFDRYAKPKHGIVTHMAFLYAAHTLSISLCAKGSLPIWYRPRPTQIAFSHDSFIDYFLWPGLRERLVLGQPAITDDFWDLYMSCCQFIWPFPSSEAYERNAETGRYRFSELYKTYLEDLKNYTLDHRFFTKYPAVYEDVAPYMVGWSSFSRS